MKRRLAAQQPSLQRMRQRATELQAEADQRMGRISEPIEMRPEVAGLASLTGRFGGLLGLFFLLLWWWLG